MKYNAIKQIQYTMAVIIGDDSQYTFHKCKLPKWLKTYTKSIKRMHGRIWNSDYSSPWAQGLYETYDDLAVYTD